MNKCHSIVSIVHGMKVKKHCNNCFHRRVAVCVCVCVCVCDFSFMSDRCFEVFV